jgi:DNA-binding response OmpR family regulator
MKIMVIEDDEEIRTLIEYFLKKEKYEILSEEIGHYKTTFGNITNQNKTKCLSLNLFQEFAVQSEEKPEMG